MRLRLVTGPAAQPVSVAEAAAHVEVIGSAHDAKLGAMLGAALAHVDGRDGVLGRALITQTWELLLDGFPACEGLEIPLPPLQSITSIKYVDPDGVEQTLEASRYIVDAASQPGVVTRAYGQAWPAERRQRNAVTVRFVAGYGAAGADVPAPIRHAMLLMVGDLFENREAQITGTIVTQNPAVDRLLFPYKLVRP